MEQILNKIYNNPSNPAGFAGAQQLYNEAQKVDHTIRKKDVEHFLQGHRTYSLMRPRRVHFKRAKTIAAGFMTHVQVDLADMKDLSRHNKGHKYILVAIDVLSKRIWAIPIKKKEAGHMVPAFKELISQMPMKCHRIFSDNGKEFVNKELRDFFEQNDILKHEASSSVIKAALAERAIRNLKQRLYRYFNHNKTLKWIEVLPEIVDAINHSVSRVHGMRPIDVNFKNATQVWHRIYGDPYSLQTSKKNPRFKEGDLVRTTRGVKKLFEKEVVPSWGDTILEVEAVKQQKGDPETYKVRNIKGGPRHKGPYYAQELARVRPEADTEHKIEKAYRKRKLGDGTFEVEVKYVGDIKRYWIKETELV
jgi:hypothetical protein